MTSVHFTLNELREKDATLARRFEEEICDAASTALDSDAPLGCRIARWGQGLVSIQLDLPGWVKSLGVSVLALPGEVRLAVASALRTAVTLPA